MQKSRIARKDTGASEVNGEFNLTNPMNVLFLPMREMILRDYFVELP